MLSSIVSQLQQDPAAYLSKLCFMIPAVLLALTCHEVAHGYVALRCGDPTAKMMGRLSFNPLHHLDPLGTLCMVFLGFGWAKPVPVNPRNFRHYVRDDIFVSVAGITVNLMLFLLSTLLMAAVNQIMFAPEFLEYYGASSFLSVKANYFWGIYTGSKDFFDALVEAGAFRVPFLFYVQRFLMIFSVLNLCLAIFNLIPIPPLDGYHLVNDVLLKGRLQLNRQTFWLCQIGLIALCFGTNILDNFLSSAVEAVQSGLVAALTKLLGIG